MKDHVGLQIGNYRLLRLLGEGGFASVYLGEHLYLGSQAAIKLMHTHVAHNDIGQFQQEGRLLASLKHPSIVRVLDFGIDHDLPYLVTEYAPGGTIRSRHPKGTRVPLATVLSYVQQVGSALQYAHERKLIHRDVKPANMLIGSHGELLLSDFGIALVAQSSRYSSTKDMAGTIAYMAPEQIQGHPRPASDQYSLAIVVYEWLSGSLPFRGTLPEIAVQHSITQPPSLLQQLPSLPLAVEHVLITALAKQPEERFSSIHAFVTAFEQASSDGLLTLRTAQESTTSFQPIWTSSRSQNLHEPSTKPTVNSEFAIFHNTPTPTPSIDMQRKLTTLSAIPKPTPPSKHKPGRSLGFIVFVLLILGFLIGGGGYGYSLVSRYHQQIQATATVITQKEAVTTAITQKEATTIVEAASTATVQAAFHAYQNNGAHQSIQFGFDAAHTHWNPFEKSITVMNVAHLTLQWSYATGGLLYSSPTVADGIVYIGSYDGKMYAFDATCRRSCQPLWSYTTGGLIYSSPAVTGGMVYIGSRDKKVYAFDATCRNSCQPLWSYTTGSWVDSSPTVAGGMVYVASGDRKLYAFDATCRNSCQPLWSYATGDWINTSPAVAGGIVYVASGDHKMYAFDATCRTACQPLWSYATGDWIDSSPAIAGGMVYVGSGDSKVYAFDAACRTNCQPLWSYATGGWIYSSPAIANGMVYVGSRNGKVYAFDATCRNSCQPLWSYTTGDLIHASLIIAGALVYIGSFDHKVYAFDATCHSACQPLWSYTTGNQIFSSPAVADGMVYIGSNDGKLYAFGLSE
jgi:serine/threonine protein kinase/outer membrane protein assembly factor BamB